MWMGVSSGDGGTISVVDTPSEWYEFVQWPIVESMLALSFGLWILWGQRVHRNSAVQQTLAAESP